MMWGDNLGTVIDLDPRDFNMHWKDDDDLTCSVFDYWEIARQDWPDSPQFAYDRHNKSANAGFMDGHAEGFGMSQTGLSKIIIRRFEN